MRRPEQAQRGLAFRALAVKGKRVCLMHERRAGDRSAVQGRSWPIRSWAPHAKRSRTLFERRERAGGRGLQLRLPLPFEKAVHRFKRGTDYGDKGMGASSVAGL